jgi:hypothetical protein
MDIQQLRARMPHLANLDDQQVVDVVQRVYYPKVDRAVIAERLGVRLPDLLPEEPGLLRSAGDSAVARQAGPAQGNAPRVERAVQ